MNFQNNSTGNILGTFKDGGNHLGKYATNKIRFKNQTDRGHKKILVKINELPKTIIFR